MKNTIRAFISYSHENKEFVSNLAKYLNKECHVNVFWDENLAPGSGFHQQIKDSIASSHVFIPVITPESSNRGWVHQEIGYANALNITVLPITTDNLDPGGVLQMLHAIKIEHGKENFENYLNHRTFEILLSNAISLPIFHCAHLPEERTRMITEFSDKISNIGEYGLVRQKGGLSSFHIPEECILKPVWKNRYHPEIKSEFHKRLQRGERIALQKHAEKAGFKIILSPEYAIKGRQRIAIVARLETLINFLSKFTNSQPVVAINKSEKPAESLTIVGDFFLAESVSFKRSDGFTNTFFTRDALEIRQRIEDFDCELEEILDEQGWTAENSKENAITYLTKLLSENYM